VHTILIIKPEGNWNNNIKINLKNIGCEVVNRIHMAQDGVQGHGVVNMAMNSLAPQMGNFLAN
jgi:hypothetical protein